MTRTTEPLPSRLHRALGMNPTRLEVLRIAAADGEVSASEVMVQLGLSRNGARKHLRALEACGLLSSGLERRGPLRSIVVWTAVPDEILDLVDDLDLYLRAP